MTSNTIRKPSEILGLERCEHEKDLTTGNSGWPLCDAQFAGWAPTVSSRFTFSMAGAQPDENKVTVNLPTPGGKRHLAHLEFRETKDAIWMSRVRKRSKYCCYLVAETCSAKQLRPNIVDKLGLAPCPESQIPVSLEMQRQDDERISAAAVAAAQVVKKSTAKTLTPALKAKALSATREALSTMRIQSNPTGNGEEELQSVSDSHGKLSGIACMFFPLETAAKGSLELLSKELRATIEELNKAPVLSGSHREVENPETFMRTATEALASKVDVADGHSLFLCRFELHRSGELRIFVHKEGLPREMLFPITEEQNAQLVSNPTLIHKFPTAKNSAGNYEVNIKAADLVSEDVPDFLKHRLQRQVEIIFDFVRDTFHNHYHHTAEDDRMVNAFRTSVDDDYSWRLGTLQRLMTTVQVGRRSKSEPVLVNSMGILSYVEAFQNQIAGVVRHSSNFEGFYENFRLKPHNLKHLESSLQIETDRQLKNSQTKLQVLLVAISFMLSAAAIYFGAIFRVPFADTPGSFFNNLANLNIKELLIFVISSIFVIFVAGAFLLEIAADRAYSFGPTRKSTVNANRIWTTIFVSITKAKFISNKIGKRLIALAGTLALLSSLAMAYGLLQLAYALIKG